MEYLWIILIVAIPCFLCFLCFLCFHISVCRTRNKFDHVDTGERMPSLPPSFRRSLGYLNVLKAFSIYGGWDKIFEQFPEHKLIRIPLGTSNFVLTRDPKVIKEIYVTKYHSFVSSGQKNASAVKKPLSLFQDDSMMTQTIPVWRPIRVKLNKGFTASSLADCTVDMMNNTEILIDQWQKLCAESDEVLSTVCDVVPFMGKLILDITAQSAFGFECGALSDSKTSKMIQASLDAFKDPSVIMGMMGCGCCNSGWEKAKINFENLADKLLDTIQDRISKIARGEKTPKDLLNVLVDSHGGELSTRAKLAHALLFILAGKETTTIALTWCLWNLAKNPRVQEKLRDEINRVFEGKDLTKELKDMKYLSRVLKENLRIVPPFPYEARIAEEDCTLGDYNIAKNTWVIDAIWEMHHDPEFFPNPLEFRPERWEKGHKIPPGAWHPFIMGPRNCIGQNFSLLEQRIIIVMIIRNFRLSTTADFSDFDQVKRQENLVASSMELKEMKIKIESISAPEIKVNLVRQLSEVQVQSINNSSEVKVSENRSYPEEKTSLIAKNSSVKIAMEPNHDSLEIETYQELLALPRPHEEGDNYTPWKIPPNLTTSGRLQLDLAMDDDSDKERMLILFGSQTGVAENFSFELQREALNRGFIPRTLVIDSYCSLYGADHLAVEPLVIFIMSTYGEGGPTDTATMFYDWLLAEKSTKMLSYLKTAVFGLGDKSYTEFNAMGKMTHKKLVERGATMLLDLGEGNAADHSTVATWKTWKQQLWGKIDAGNKMVYQKTVGVGKDASKFTFTFPYPPIYSFKIKKVEQKDHQGFIPASTSSVLDSMLGKTFTAKIAEHRNLCKYGDVSQAAAQKHNLLPSQRTVCHMDLRVDDGFVYETGDHLGIYPQNDHDVVEKVAKAMGIENMDEYFILNDESQNNLLYRFPCPCSYRTALTRFLDLNAPVSQELVLALAECATNPAEQLHLYRLASIEGKVEFDQWVTLESRSFLELLHSFPSVHLESVGIVLQLLPRLQFRYFSISSSPMVKTNNVSITVALVKWWKDKEKNRLFLGTATSQICLKRTHNLKVFVRSSPFRLPPIIDSKIPPLIMVCGGTGLAPFMGFLQELQIKHDKEKLILSDNLLFFGCRTKDTDFLYADELHTFVKAGILSKLITAFSRAQSQKIYVQHRIHENVEMVWDLLNKGAYIYIAGAKIMSQDVIKTIKADAVQAIGNMNENEATKFMDDLKYNKRLQTDVW